MKARSLSDPWWLAVWDRDVAPVIQGEYTAAEMIRCIRRASPLLRGASVAINMLAAADGERVTFDGRVWVTMLRKEQET